VGILSISLSTAENYSHHYSKSTALGSQTWQLKVTETLKPTSFSKRYIAHVIALDQQLASGEILVSFPIDTLSTALQIDDEFVIYSQPQLIKAPLNPHQFDYRAYLNDLGINHQLHAKGGFVRLKKASPTIYGKAAALRQHIIAKLKKADFGAAELAIIQALLLGQRDDISEATYNNYKNAGAVHILAVSGLHIGILLLLLQFLLQPLEALPKGKTIKLVVIVLLLWGFALLAGFSASIVRAVTMFSFVAYALYLNRPSNTFNILALSMFFMLLVINPKLLFQVGFQMSYAAVFAIVWIYPLLQKLWFPKNGILRKLWQLLSVSIAAQLGVLPISLFYFHQFPGLFFVSNIILVPALGAILGMGILVIILALCNALPQFIVAFYDYVIRTMNGIIAWVADQEAFVFKNISFDVVQLILAYGILIGLVLFLSKPNFKKALVTALTIISFQGYLFYTKYQANHKEALLVLHQTRNSILVHQSGTALKVNAADSTRTTRMLTNYSIAARTANIYYTPLANRYTWKDKSLVIIDSTAIYDPTSKDIDYLLLRQSPRINLARLIDSIAPKQIIADGSNYRSFINQWKKTCIKRKLPFHYTAEKGAYYFK